MILSTRETGFNKAIGQLSLWTSSARANEPGLLVRNSAPYQPFPIWAWRVKCNRFRQLLCTTVFQRLNYADPSFGSVSFTSTYDADYDATPNLTALAGTFTGEVASSGGMESGSATIESNGSFTGSTASGCTFTGTAVPRSRGNVFDISISFGGALCKYNN